MTDSPHARAQPATIQLYINLFGPPQLSLLGTPVPLPRRQLRALRGYPVVVNKWASWCGPCRAEFPVFQKASIQEAKRIAFLGVDSSDNDGDAGTFLSDFPLSYPSYRDPDLKVARVFHGVGAFPTTVFYDKNGKLAYTHQGPYQSVGDLVRDVRRYTGGA